MDSAFRRDFVRNGPSLDRSCRTTLAGWKRYKNDLDPRVRARFQWEVRALREEMAREFGFASKAWAMVLAPFLLWTSRREEKRLAHGVTYEPKTIIQRRDWDGV